MRYSRFILTVIVVVILAIGWGKLCKYVIADQSVALTINLVGAFMIGWFVSGWSISHEKRIKLQREQDGWK